MRDAISQADSRIELIRFTVAERDQPQEAERALRELEAVILGLATLSREKVGRLRHGLQTGLSAELLARLMAVRRLRRKMTP